MSDQLERYRWFIVALFCVPLLAGIAYLLIERLQEPSPLQIDETQAVPTDIRVYITGAVLNPGVYPAEEDARWIDVLEAAGGPSGDADLNAVNLSRRVRDEDQIFVPSVGGAQVGDASRAPLVNINTADVSELEGLPGIGQVRARSIVDSRTSEGPFATVEDLLARSVIPESVFNEIVPLITVTQ